MLAIFRNISFVENYSYAAELAYKWFNISKACFGAEPNHLHDLAYSQRAYKFSNHPIISRYVIQLVVLSLSLGSG